METYESLGSIFILMSTLFSGEYSLESGCVELDWSIVELGSYLENLEQFSRKLWIAVEGSVGPVLLKAEDPYSNRGESHGF